MREAATSTLKSGVIAQRLEHGLVAQRVYTRREPAAALEHRQADRSMLCGNGLGAKAQMQPFLDQPRQARALSGREGLGLGEELVPRAARHLAALLRHYK